MFRPDLLKGKKALVTGGGTGLGKSIGRRYLELDAVLNIVLHGSLYCTLAAGKRWIEAGRKGSVLSIISTPSFTGAAFQAPSAIAKAGVLAMTRSLAVEWGPKGVRLVAIAPGLFPTPR